MVVPQLNIISFNLELGLHLGSKPLPFVEHSNTMKGKECYLCELE
jgi:hypothetical protein